MHGWKVVFVPLQVINLNLLFFSFSVKVGAIHTSFFIFSIFYSFLFNHFLIYLYTSFIFLELTQDSEHT